MGPIAWEEEGSHPHSVALHALGRTEDEFTENWVFTLKSTKERVKSGPGAVRQPLVQVST